jgi:predicted nuclease with TOPRIM domain
MDHYPSFHPCYGTSPIRDRYEGLETWFQARQVGDVTSVEPARHALYAVLEDVLGTEHAETLMTHLPQHESDEVATKADLGRVETRIDDRFDRMDERFDRMEDRFDRMEDRFDERFNRMEVRIDKMNRNFVTVSFGTLTVMTAIFALLTKIWA